MNIHYPFEMPPLPYETYALEPYLSQETVELHYNNHFRTYVENLNRTLERYPAYQNWPLERLIRENCRLPFQIQTAVWHNAGGVYNHSMYFNILGRPDNSAPSENSALYNAILTYCGSMESFRSRLTECAKGQFGSGWGWLVSDRFGRLKIINTPNQDTPLACGLCPVIPLDVWEHAYYLQYQNRRSEYIEGFFHLLNFEAAERNYQACITPLPCSRRSYYNA
ncbi:MAG TPA: superoxide dismutase [Caproicibacter sp.]|nr:superoxide dismutase [Caproicibacter sp.]